MKAILRRLYFGVIVPIKSIFAFSKFILASLFLVATIIYGVSFEAFLEQDIFKAQLSDLSKIQNWRPKDNSTILDKNGKVIGEQFNEYHVYIPFEKIPKDVIDTVLAIEDRKFWTHNGVDILGIFRAALSHIKPKRGGLKQGASTITQQVVKNLVLTKDKTIKRKLREMVLSLYLEKVVSKEKIIEIYCNRMFLGNGAYGIGAAAKRYFNKTIDQLEKHEMALIAGLFQSPGKYNPARYPERAKKRQLQVLAAMAQTGVIKKAELGDWKKKELAYKEYKSSHGTIAPYFIDYVVEESEAILNDLEIPLKDSGIKIHTSLDTKLNRLAEDSIRESNDIFKNMEKSIILKNRLEKGEKPKVEAAMVVLDRRTGNIVSMVGGRDYNDSQFNRTYQSLRAPGSVFKSITYALGLKRGRSWNKQYYISPITIGNYRPRTQYSKLFSETTMFESFYKSINSPAVSLGSDLGVKRVIRFGEKLGIETPLKDEAATLLGGSDVTMLDMARVYSTFSNGGVLNKVSAITKIEDRNGKILYEAPKAKDSSKRILDRRSNQLIVEGLKSVLRYGTGYRARHLSGYAAGKTGTSNNSKDNWFCGFTNDLVVVTWLGSDDQDAFRGNISASNTAAPLWARFVKKSMRHLKTRRLARPNLLARGIVHPKYGHRDSMGVAMYFRPGKVPRKEKSDLLKLEQGQQLRIGMNDF